MKVPVPHDQFLSNTNMRNACLVANLQPLCAFREESSECSMGNLPGDKFHNSRNLAKLLCPDARNPCDCPILDGVFFFADDWSKDGGHQAGDHGAGGVMIRPLGGSQNWMSDGAWHKSGHNNRPLYSACVKESGTYRVLFLTVPPKKRLIIKKSKVTRTVPLTVPPRKF